MIPTQNIFRVDGKDSMRKINRAVFKEPQGMREERPLSKLARQLMPKLEMLKIEGHELRGGADPNGNRFFEATLTVPWSNKPYVMRGYAKDEMEVYQHVRKTFAEKGYRFDDVD